jgi:hypothetical protein
MDSEELQNPRSARDDSEGFYKLLSRFQSSEVSML